MNEELSINIQILENIINFLLKVLNPFEKVALSLAAALIIIDLVLTFANGEADIFKVLPFKFFKYGFFLTIIKEYNWVMTTIINGAIQIANYGGANSTSTSLLISPLMFFSKIMVFLGGALGSTTAGALALDLAGVESIPIGLISLVIMITISALLMSIEIIMIVVEYYLIGICAILLIPFGCCDKTTNFAMKGIGSLFAQSFKILMFTLLLNFIDKQWKLLFKSPVVLDFGVLSTTLFSLLIFYFLIKRVSAISGALMGGTSVSSSWSSPIMASTVFMASKHLGQAINSAINKNNTSGPNNNIAGYMEATSSSNKKEV